MREIEFRGKRVDNGEWVYGSLFVDLCYGGTPEYYIEYMEYGSLPYRVSKKVNSETIGQYTGLKDKNGTKIFEGDIVKLTRTNMYAPSTSFHNQDLVSLHRIYWNDEKHYFYQEHFDIEKKRVTGGGSLNFNDERAKQNIIEVIGNIYDNPELLTHQHEDKGENK